LVTYFMGRTAGVPDRTAGGQRAVFHSEMDVLLVGQHRRPHELVMERANDAHRAQGEREGTCGVTDITHEKLPQRNFNIMRT